VSTWRPNELPSVVWHYTYENNIEAILKSGALLPPCQVLSAARRGMTEEDFAAHMQDKGCAADAKLLLFSARQDWEPASFRGFMSSTGEVTDLHQIEDYAKHGFRMFRIGVKRDKLKPWQKLKSLVNMPRDMVQSLEGIAFNIGANPYDWWGTVLPVPCSEWVDVQEFYHGSRMWETCAKKAAA